MSYIPLYNVKYTDSEILDSFGRLRISQNNILFNSEQIGTNLPLLFQNSSSGASTTASYDNTRSSTILQTGTNSGSIVVRQTKQYFRYEAGESQFINISFSSGSVQTGVSKKVGYFDSNDGIFFEASGSSYYFVLRSSVNGIITEERVEQSNWNLDAFDGSGSSGVNLDFSKAQIFACDLQWLGVGRVRIGFNINGIITYAHEFLNSNVKDSVYMRTATLPIRYELVNLIAVATSPGLEAICGTVIREGGRENLGSINSVSVFNQNTTATTSPRNLLSIKLMSGSIRKSLKPIAISTHNRGTQSIRWRLILNPTYASGSLTWGNSGSISQTSITQLDYIEASGRVLNTGFVASGVGTTAGSDTVAFDTNLRVVSDIDGNSDILSLIVDAVSATNNIDASITYIEYI